MDEETIEHIEKEAHILAKKYKAMHEYDYVFAAYVRGAEAEHSRITELLKEKDERIAELLEALEGMIEANFVMPRPPHPLYIAVRKAKAAIEKVKGKQQ